MGCIEEKMDGGGGRAASPSMGLREYAGDEQLFPVQDFPLSSGDHEGGSRTCWSSPNWFSVQLAMRTPFE